MATECFCKHENHDTPIDENDHPRGAEFESLFQMHTYGGRFLVCEWCKNHHFTSLPNAPDTQRIIV